jgi:hypothetical protein
VSEEHKKESQEELDKERVKKRKSTVNIRIAHTQKDEDKI